MKKLLITGASGFLGWNLCHIARKEWDICGTTFSHALDIPGVTTRSLDLRDFEALKQLFAEVKPDAVVHAAACSKPNYCQNHPNEAYGMNVTVTRNIAGLCADAEIPCVFTSTDLIFDGLNAPYKETHSPNPICIYGEQKVIAEESARSRYPKIAICRMPVMFGLPSPASPSFLQGFIRTLREGKEIALFTDEYRSSVSASTAAKGLLLALEKAKGTIHLGGKERLSRYDFGRLMAEVLELPSTGIKACLQKDVKMSAPRPSDVSLDSSKAFDLGYNPPLIREELEQLKGKV
ncbi:SDR family oxidoreductase [Lusitaniella coriacea]|uniref:SDR family oxidoreductase n=1 Tax=Lusitaniella coriacea TaxID=1983105 RepID=UPI003CEE0DE4